MNEGGSGCWMGTYEPSHSLLTLSGFQTDVLVSDYNSKDILTIPIEGTNDGETRG